MKEKFWRWIKRYRLAGALFLIGALAAAVYGSFAAYTNFNSVKRVVSTKRQDDDNTMFSSNYLSLMHSNDTCPAKRISLAESNDNKYTFTVLVCNHVWGDESLYNPKNISYTLTAKLLSMDGGDLPEGCTGANGITLNVLGDSVETHIFGENGEEKGVCTILGQELKTGAAAQKSYQFIMPKALKDKVKIQIEAVPADGSKAAVNNQILGAVLSFADYQVTKNWTGHFIDSKENGKNPGQYDAFNYEITGNGAGTVTVTWSDELLLSQWAMENGKELTHNNTNSTYSYKFTVDNSTTVKQFQFYRNPKKLLDGKDWKKLESLVTVSFSENTQGQQNTETSTDFTGAE